MKHAEIASPATSADIAAILAELVALRALLEQALSIAPPCTFVTPAAAAKLALRSPQTITAWCRSDRIGVKVKRHWQVNLNHLRSLMRDRFGELPPGLRE